MKVRIGRRSRADAKHSVRSPDGLALAPAFSEGRWDVPDHFNFTRDVVEALASDAKRRALVHLGPDGVIEHRSFLQITEDMARWAALLREREVKKGDRVLVLVSPSVDWLEIMLAGIKIGAVTVPRPETLSAAALDELLASTGARLVVASRFAEHAITAAAGEPNVLYTDELRSRASDPVPDVPTENTSARDVAFILSTSGTARGPLAVAHTHGSTFAARVQAEHWLDAGPGDAVWCAVDSANALAAWHVLLGPWSRGAEVIVQHGVFDPHERLDLIDRLGTTVLCQSPAEYAALTELRDFHRYRPRRLRRLVSTGDTLDPSVIEAYEAVWGMTIHEGYGQAETGVIVANGIDTGFRTGSVGLPIVGHEVAVVDDQGNVVEAGVEGELALKGRPPSLFAHYWDAPEETKAAFRGDWYMTGDLASTDEDGFVWLVGRAEDVITSRGRRFGPLDVERALRDHVSVAESAVVGIRDLERGGQFVRAFVVPRTGIEPTELLGAELRHFVGESLPEYEVPREIEFVERLPRTASGNVRRAELREQQTVGQSLWKTPPVTEPDPIVFAPSERQPVVPPEPTPVPPFGQEPTAFAEPTPIPVPLDEPIVLSEPEPIVLSEPEPTPIVEPDPEPVAFVEPTPVEPEPAPVAEPETAPRPVTSDPPAQLPNEPPPAEPLPDYVIVPGSERAPEPETQTGAPDIAALGLPPVTNFGLDRPHTPETNVPKPEREKPTEPPKGDPKRGARPSTGEPGDEIEGSGWMQGLSTRLSAYSLAGDDAPAAPAEEHEGEREPDDEDE
jgi:acetyl-CoA synthetase/medium-chain acyl-CoA synthetase